MQGLVVSDDRVDGLAHTRFELPVGNADDLDARIHDRGRLGPEQPHGGEREGRDEEREGQEGERADATFHGAVLSRSCMRSRAVR